MKVLHYLKLRKNIISYKSLPGHASKLRKQWKRKECNGAPSCICLKGSYTLEAAMIYPLVAAFIVCFLFFFRVMQVEMAVDEALVYAGRVTAVEYSVIDGEAAGLASAEVFFRKELKQYPRINQFVKGGSLGISLQNSKFDSEYVELCAEYKMKIPVPFLPVKDIPLIQRCFQRKWTGKSVAADDFDPFVYITETGSVYHTSAFCHYIDLSIKAVEFSKIEGLRNVNGHKYSACSCAVVNCQSPSTVYITNYGTHFHATLGCSGLKRSVKMVRKSEVNGKPPCSKCGDE